MENNHNNPTFFNPQEMLWLFDAIKEKDRKGCEWWNSRKLARGLVYVPQKAKMGVYHFQYVPEKAFWDTY